MIMCYTNPLTHSLNHSLTHTESLAITIICYNRPDDRVSGHDELGVSACRVLEQLALGLNKHVVSWRQLHPIHTAQVGPDVTN